MKNTIKGIIVAAAAFTMPFILGYSFGSKNREVSEKIGSVNALIEYGQSLPSTNFKSNLFTVLGAEFGGSSDELNQILRTYSEMKIEEMKKDKSI